MAVTHRLATIANYDRVLVVGNGRILEDGNPAGLNFIGNSFFTDFFQF